jgi:hypothetical protein
MNTMLSDEQFYNTLVQLACHRAEQQRDEQHDRAEYYADALRDIARLCQGHGVGLRDDVMDIISACGLQQEEP